MFKNAVIKEAPDGHPVALVEASWTDSLDDISDKIEAAVTGNVANYHPRFKSRMKSLAFMINIDHGSMFITEKDLTSMSTLLIGNKKHKDVQKFWERIDELLTVYGQFDVTDP